MTTKARTQPTKNEQKLLKHAKRLEKITKKYLKKLGELDVEFQNLPTSVSRCYNLEDKYFKHVPVVASKTVQLELLYAKLYNEIIGSMNDSETAETET